MTSKAALSLHELSRTYGEPSQAVRALDGVDLTINPGTFTAVMGPSGSGKSTLLNCSAGLEAPSSGRVVVGGLDLGDMSEAAQTKLRRQQIGVVFQGFHLMPYLSAEQNVGLPRRLAGRRADRKRVRELLGLVGLGERMGHLPGELSGGQQQRVAIARALVNNPAIVLADEPTGALDSASARGVLGLLRRTVDTMGQTVMMVTHDPVAAAHADGVVFLLDGRIAGKMENPTADAVARQMAHLDDLVAAAVAS